MRRSVLGFLTILICIPRLAFSWGDEGHEIVGLIAQNYLDPTVLQQVNALLVNDTSGLTGGTDIAHEATWADKYRDAGDRKLHYTETQNWHFVDIEIDGTANMDAACFQHPALPAGTAASAGAAKDCSVDKITQFSAELRDTNTAPAERLMALQFLLHFVGDEHQPLHSSDDHDLGGNSKKVKATGLAEGKLHAYWDTQFVQKLSGGTDPNTVASQLISQITNAERQSWTAGTPSDWAQESFALAQQHSYGLLPQPTNGIYVLPDSYVQDATQVVAVQLQKAGVRLASILNSALGTQGACGATSRTAALPDLTTVAGILVSTTETSAGILSSSKQHQLTTTLSFDESSPTGLQQTLEGALKNTGWTFVESESGKASYVSRWSVTISGCGTQTGLLTLAPTQDGSHYLMQLFVQN